MRSEDAVVEMGLLEIAKDLLQASDDLAATDPSASANLAHQAYEIGRDLEIVRHNLEPSPVLTEDLEVIGPSTAEPTNGHASSQAAMGGPDSGHRWNKSGPSQHLAEDDGDDDLLRILDRQRAVVPSLAGPEPLHHDVPPFFGAPSPAGKRSNWFRWRRSRDLRQVI